MGVSGKLDSATKINIDGLEFIFQDESNHTLVTIKTKDRRFKYDFKNIDYFLDILRILTGYNLYFSSAEIHTELGSKMLLKSISKNAQMNTHMPPFIDLNSSIPIEILGTKLSNLLSFQRRNKNFSINRILNKCIATSTNSVHAFATVVCISVEEIISIYFYSNFEVSESFNQKLEHAKRELNKTDIDKTIRNNLFSSLDIYKKITVRKVFKKLRKEGLLEKDIIENWDKLRSYIAHPSNKSYSTNELLYYAESSTFLLYKLIEIIIDFEKDFSRLSIRL